jgi:hypothetical protein
MINLGVVGDVSGLGDLQNTTYEKETVESGFLLFLRLRYINDVDTISCGC